MSVEVKINQPATIQNSLGKIKARCIQRIEIHKKVMSKGEFSRMSVCGVRLQVINSSDAQMQFVRFYSQENKNQKCT
jgi:hypothetical protein